MSPKPKEKAPLLTFTPVYQTAIISRTVLFSFKQVKSTKFKGTFFPPQKKDPVCSGGERDMRRFIKTENKPTTIVFTFLPLAFSILQKQVKAEKNKFHLTSEMAPS